jgi:CheY-like chemotaxis protein/signal transduction histidine kinase
MNRFHLFGSLRVRLIFWFTAICLVPLALVTTIIYFQRAKVVREQIFDKLSSTIELRLALINSLLDDTAGDAASLAAESSMEQGAKTLASGTKADLSSVRATARGYLDAHYKVAEVAIVDRNGTILFSSNASRIGTQMARPAVVVTALRDRNVAFGDVFIWPGDQTPCLDIAVPIRTTENRAALVFRLDMRRSVYTILENRTGMGKSGESLLVNRDVVAISELRGQPGALLKAVLTGRPAQRAAQGQSGIAETLDYRGVEVLAAYAYIPHTGWGLVTKQDISEIMAPLKSLLYVTYGLASLISLLVCLFAIALARSITRPLSELAQATVEIGAGDYSSRVVADGSEELGLLADSFNSMAETLQIRMAARLWLARLSDQLTSIGSLKDFFSTLLPLLMQATGAKMAAGFMQEGDSDYFVPLHSIGADPSSMRRFNRRNLEGELGVLLTSDGISRYSPENGGAPLTFVTSFGEIAPHEIVTIPIKLNETVLAFISLAAEVPFTETALEVIEQIRLPLSAGFSRVMAGEDVRHLAEELSVKNTELIQQSEELIQQTMELTQQSDELYRRNSALDEQRGQLEVATRLKSEFLSNMSHELRTPLNSVLALSRVLSLQAAQRLTEDERNYLTIIERNGRNLLSLINDILDLAKIESGKQELSADRFSVMTLIGEMVDQLMPLARDKGITLDYEARGVVPQIVSDMKRVRQIVQNLIGNAVKFTATGGASVTLQEDAGMLVIAVADSGIGIPPNHLHSIFEEFRQVDGSTSRSFEGTGLGLAIVRKTALMLGGDVTVASEVGKGSTFTVRLPLGGQTVSGRAAVHGDVALSPPADALSMHRRRCVLVVDDDPETVSLIAGYLAQSGYETITALNGRDALQLARARKPYAISLDILMPEMDGWEVMRHLKGDSATRDIPIIIVSLANDHETGVALGAVGIVAKPVDREELMCEFEKMSAAGIHTVLVVDDNDQERFAIAALLKEIGLDVLLAENGERALELARQHHPDLISLDMMMPGMNGAEVLDRLRSDSVTAAIPVVIITSKELDASERARLSSSVSTILSKGELNRVYLLRELERNLENINWRLPSVTTATGSRLLIVEDSDAAEIQVRYALETAGFVVDSVSGGAAALEYLHTHVPDGIVLDLMMPGVDGFAVLAALRSAPLTRTVPVMVMTAKNLTPGDIERLTQFGVRSIVQKGDVDLHELLTRLHEALGINQVFRDSPRSLVAEPLAEYRGNGSILVVEDNPDNMASIKAVLGRRYPLLEARDGEQGLKLARDVFPSLILLDMQLPLMDGMTVLRKLKADVRTCRIPVVALTASAMRGDRERFMAAGCADYVSKPYEIADLEAVVQRFAAGSGDIP